MKKNLGTAAAILALIVGVGCGSGNSGGGSSGGGTSTVDMAVMDRDYNNDLDYQVMLWLDVLANTGPGLPTPDLVLDPTDRTPVDGIFYNGDLYVAATDQGGPSGGILIWRDYLNATDGATADVILDDTSTPTAGPQNAQRLAIDDDVLASATWYDDAVYIFDNASALVSGDNPDVVLDEVSIGAGAGNFGSPVDVALVGTRLYVSNSGTTGATQIQIAIWDDVNDLIANGASAPDVVLEDDDNFLDLNQSAKHITVANDILYVGGESGGPSGNAGLIFVFNGAAALTSASLPDNVLVGCVDSSSDNICYIESPGRLTVADNVLWVANKNENNVGNDNPAVTGFFPADNLFQNQTPSVFVGNPPLPGQAERVVAAGGALFVTGSPDNYDAWDRTGIFIYSSASGLTANDQPTLSAVGDPDTTNDLSFMRFPTGIAVTVRGTFDNFVDNGT